MSIIWMANGKFIYDIYPWCIKQLYSWFTISGNERPILPAWWTYITFQFPFVWLACYGITALLDWTWGCSFMATENAGSDFFGFLPKVTHEELVYRDVVTTKSVSLARIHAKCTFANTLLSQCIQEVILRVYLPQCTEWTFRTSSYVAIGEPSGQSG